MTQPDNFYRRLDNEVKDGTLADVAALMVDEPNQNYDTAQTYAFEQAIEYGRVDIVKKLLKEKADKHPYLLTRAAYLNHNAIVELLLKSGSKPSDDPRILDIAIRKHRIKLINKLLDVDPKLVDSCKTCVETVAITGSLPILNILLENGAEKHINDTAVNNAIKYHNFSIMDRLYNLLPPEKRNTLVPYLLFQATDRSNLDGVRYLLSKPECTQEAKDSALSGAVHNYASIERAQANTMHQYPEIISALVDKGADFKVTSKQDILDLPFRMTEGAENPLTHTKGNKPLKP